MNYPEPTPEKFAELVELFEPYACSLHECTHWEKKECNAIKYLVGMEIATFEEYETYMLERYGPDIIDRARRAADV